MFKRKKIYDSPFSELYLHEDKRKDITTIMSLKTLELLRRRKTNSKRYEICNNNPGNNYTNF